MERDFPQQSSSEFTARYHAFLDTKKPGEWFTWEELVTAFWPQLPEDAAREIAADIVRDAGLSSQWIVRDVDDPEEGWQP